MKLDKRQTTALIILASLLLAYMAYNEFQKYDTKQKAKQISKDL